MLVAAVLALALGLLAGWWLRGEAARDACLDSGGKWLAKGGYCISSKFGEMEP